MIFGWCASTYCTVLYFSLTSLLLINNNNNHNNHNTKRLLTIHFGRYILYLHSPVVGHVFLMSCRSCAGYLPRAKFLISDSIARSITMHKMHVTSQF
jgi:hypothetical protein